MDAGGEQDIRFCRTSHGRMAYASVGDGPVLLLPAPWISHVELEWQFPELRSFVRALARDHRVVRYDRLGTGLSDRDVGPFGLDTEVDALEALVAELGAPEVSLLGISWGGCGAIAFAARHPGTVRRVALFGAYACGGDIAPAPLRAALTATVRAHWGAGSRALADVWLPNATPSARRRFAQLQRASATPEAAARALEAVYGTDVTALARTVSAPALVVHRRRDRAIPFELGRQLASLMPDARLVPLAGDLHPPWLGDSGAVVRALRSFLSPETASGRSSPEPAPPPLGDGPLTDREREVLRLVASGLTNDQIASALVVSPHTVHRHVANVRLKLGEPTRAAAAAHALRDGLI